MTKRVLLSLLLLALALCLSVTSYVLLQNRVAKLGQALENAVYTDLPVDESCAQVEACTAHTLPYLRIFIPHTALDALTEHLNTLPLTRKNRIRFISYLAILSFKILKVKNNFFLFNRAEAES